MSELVALAERIATAAHAGQVDKAGRPYIDHPRRVAARLDDDEAKAVAWLHDVLEDTATTRRDLLSAGIPLRLVACVDHLTRRRDVPADVYYSTIARDPVDA